MRSSLMAMAKAQAYVSGAGGELGSFRKIGQLRRRQRTVRQRCYISPEKSRRFPQDRL